MKTEDKKYHYVYRITNIIQNRHYIGVHSSNIDPYKDFGIKYKSSGNSSFIKHQKENPEQYIYQILEFFDTRKIAMDYERFLHIQYDVGKNPNFYNGRIQASSNWDTFGKIKLNNGDKEIFSKLEDIEIHKSNGFTEGCLPMQEIQKFKLSLAHSGKILTEEHKENISKSTKGTTKSETMKCRLSETRKGMIYINNNSIEKIIPSFELYEYIEEGWNEGKLPMPEHHKEAISKGSIGKSGTITSKIRINNGEIEKFILKDELEYYTSLGWLKGNNSNRKAVDYSNRKGTTSGKIGINNGVNNKFILESELSNYLSDGWYKGLKSTKKHNIII